MQRPVAQAPDADEQGKDGRGAGHGQAQVHLPAARVEVLAGLLVHIEPRQADEGAEDVSPAGQGPHPGAAQGIDDHRRQHAEADEIAQGVDLDAEPLLAAGPILLGGGHLPVEHVADARAHKAQDRRRQMALEGAEDARKAGQKADIGEDHRVVVNAEHTTSHMRTAWICTKNSTKAALLSRERG